MSVRAAMGYSLAARGGMLVVMACGLAVLSRLLPPEAFGHFAIAIAVWSFLDAIVQFGLLPLFISHDEAPQRDRIARAAGLSLALAAAIALPGLALLAMLSGRLVPAETAAALAPLLVMLLIRPFTLGPEAMLQRAVRFGLLSVREFLRSVVDLSVALALTLAGYGAVALASGMLASHVASAVLLLWLAGPERRVLPRLGGWGEFIVWGRRLTLIQLMPRIAEIAMLGGLAAAQGAATLGLFNRARTIHKLLDTTLLEGIKPVVLPAFSAALRDGVAPRKVYRAKLDFLTALCWPAFALTALLAEDLVRVLLGRQWEDTVPAVRILALMGLAMPITKLSQKLFVALGETRTYLRIETVREAVRIPIAVVGALFGLEWFAAAFVLGGWIKAGGVAGVLQRRIGGPDGGYAEVALQGAALTLAALAGPVAVVWADLAAAATIALSVPLAFAGWLAAAALIGHPIHGEVRGAARRVAGLRQRFF